MSKQKLSLWLCDLTYTQQTIASDTMPMAIGGLSTYVEKHSPTLLPIKLFKYPDKLSKSLHQFGPPDIIGFSNYIWNFRLSYSFAKLIKSTQPKTITIFGGPNYPLTDTEQEEFLSQHPDIDFYIVKEGEVPLSNLINNIDGLGDLEAIKQQALPSVHSLSISSGPILPKEATRLKDLSEIPSPYLDGRLDPFFDGKLMPLLQTNRGCPFTCTFCVEGVGYYNKVNSNNQLKTQKEIEYIGQMMASVHQSRGGRNDLFIADSNFGMYSGDLTTCESLSQTKNKYGWPDYINVATGKNKKERVLEAAKILDGSLRLSGSVQSLEPNVLNNIRRNNISADGLLELALNANETGTNSYSEIILGLPGETKVSHETTVKIILDAGFTNIYLFQLMLLPGSEMSTQESRQRYQMTTMYRVLPRCYGKYSTFDSIFVSAEIEEICVSTNTLSFKDYLECRSMHLFITIFYNDGLFSSLLKLIRTKGWSPWRWIELMMSSELPNKLQSLYKNFRHATEHELWSTKEALLEFIHSPNVVDKFLNGELGNNLLFIHKSLAIRDCARELAELAQKTTKHLARENNDTSTELNQFIDDCAKYHKFRMTNLFSRLDERIETNFDYNIAAFEQSNVVKDLTYYKFPHQQLISFTLSSEQIHVVRDYLSLYGSDTVGIGRILSKVYARKLFRNPSSLESNVSLSQELTPATQFSVSGLQN